MAEGVKPFLDGVFVVCANSHTVLRGFAIGLLDKGLKGEEVNLSRSEAKAQQIVEEEVVKFVWPYEVFCLLHNLSVLVGRDEFGRDRCFYDVK